MAKATIYSDIYKSDELFHHLHDVICADDECELIDLSHKTIIHEARYVLSKYTGGLGFSHEEDFDGENGEEAYKEAKQNVKAITAFIKKWEGK
jgi:hypothetical protein